MRVLFAAIIYLVIYLAHYLWRSPWTNLPHHEQRDGPWRADRLDGVYAPRGPEVQGRYAAHHVHGWTLVGWWDRSVDHRPGSNSLFLVEGVRWAPAALAVAGCAFPSVVARQQAPLAPWRE